MNSQTSTCHPDRLESFLNGQLSAPQEHDFTSHLNTCEYCRHQLEQMAAEPEVWMDAEKLLRPSHFHSLHAEDESDSSVDAPSSRPLSPQIQNVLDALGPTDDPQMLGRLGGYEVSGIVGAGGMGVVLKAIDKSLDRTVAIKVMAPHLASSGAARKRFAREAKAAAAVLHPNVIAIHSVSNDETLPYLVMPYMRGTSLQKRLDHEGPLSVIEILRIGSQIAAGLAAAHAQGLVHRDIKPANILLEDGVERVTITDFGLARAVDDATITHSGVIAGTPQYMSPEQARGESMDQRSDLFSLGSVLYAIGSGRPPFRAETTYGVLRRITDDEPTPLREINPEIPDWLAGIISKLMSKSTSDRFGSAAEVTELLEQCLAHVQQPSTVSLPDCLTPQSTAPTWRRKSIRQGTIAMFGVLCSVLVLGMMFWPGTPRAENPGQQSGPEQTRGESDADAAPSNSGPGTVQNAGSTADTFHADLSKLTKLIQRREDSIRRISYHGTVRYLDMLQTVRKAEETNEQLISRYTSLAPQFSGIPAFPLSVLRDYPANIGLVKLGEIDLAIPKYMEYFFDDKSVTQLMGVEPGRCQATITTTRPPELSVPSETMPRMDLFALRPVHDNPLAATLEQAARTWSPPDAGGRPLFQLKQRTTSDSSEGWVATFTHQEPAGNDRKEILWYRLFWNKRGDEFVIMRVDELSVVGDANSMPVTVTLLEDYRQVDNVSIPHRVRMFRFGNSFLLGSVLNITEVKINAAVKTPTSLKIPSGTRVRRETGSNQFPEIQSVFSSLASASQLPSKPASGKDDPPSRKQEFPTHISVNKVATSADGKWIAIANGNPTMILRDDGTSRVVDRWKPAVELLDAETGKTLRVLKLTTDEEDNLIVESERVPEFEVSALAFSPRDNALAVGTTVGQVKLFDSMTGKLIQSLNDEPAKLADQKTPANLRPLTRAMGSVAALAFSPDGSLLAMCGASFEDRPLVVDRISRLGRFATGPGRLKVWDVKTGTVKQDLIGHSHANAVSFSPDGKLLASAGNWEDRREHGTGVILWDVQSGKKARMIPTDANGGCWSVAFSPNSKLIAISSRIFDRDRDISSSTIRLTRVGSGITEWQLTIPNEAQPTIFSPAGTQLAVLSGGKSLQFLDTNTGSLQHEITPGDVHSEDQWNDFAISPDGTRLVIGATDRSKHGRVEIWNLIGSRNTDD
jgi:serine/threonine protein kinase/WD40 repeat protein